MAKKYDLILFNHDGTLFQADQVRFPAVMSSLLDLRKIYNINIPLPAKETIKSLIGLSEKEFYSKLIPESYHEHLPLIIETCKSHEKENIEKGFGKLYDEVQNTLKSLKGKGYKLGLYSLSDPDYFNLISKKFKYKEWFDLFFHTGHCLHCDSKEIVQSCIKKMGSSNILVAGDCLSDIQAGLENKCETAAVLYGYGIKEDLNQAHYKLKTISQILKLVK